MKIWLCDEHFQQTLDALAEAELSDRRKLNAEWVVHFQKYRKENDLNPAELTETQKRQIQDEIHRWFQEKRLVGAGAKFSAFLPRMRSPLLRMTSIVTHSMPHARERVKPSELTARVINFSLMQKDTRLSFRVRSDLKKTLEAIAAAEGRSVAQVCEAFLKAGSENYEKEGNKILQQALAKVQFKAHSSSRSKRH